MARDGENHKPNWYDTASLSMPGTGWLVEPTKCNGCGDCVAICPVGALRVKNKVAMMVDEASCCRESCRICEYHCWRHAIKAY